MKNIPIRIELPTIYGMKEEGFPFQGILYCGLMVDENGQPRVVEFNSRFGDPEMESYMRLLDTDVFDILLACADGKLSKLNKPLYPL